MDVVKSLDGETYAVQVDVGTCADRHLETLRLCGARAPRVFVEGLPHDRPRLRACYCEAHGGTERALSDLRSDWFVLAPARVGGVEEVMAAGVEGLTSVNAYVVVRLLQGKWLAWVGIGSMLHAVSNPHAKPAYTKNGYVKKRKGRIRGLYAFESREAALEQGVQSWTALLDAKLRGVQNRRGGTLEWGVPIEPLGEPIVIEPQEGESAWDIVSRRGRESRPGLGIFTGLRPSGEAF